MIRIFSRKKQKKSASLRGDAQPRPSVEVRSPAGARDRDRDRDRVVREFGGPSGAEPTRYGDWERKGRCIDF